MNVHANMLYGESVQLVLLPASGRAVATASAPCDTHGVRLHREGRSAEISYVRDSPHRPRVVREAVADLVVERCNFKTKQVSYNWTFPPEM